MDGTPAHPTWPPLGFLGLAGKHPRKTGQMSVHNAPSRRPEAKEKRSRTANTLPRKGGCGSVRGVCVSFILLEQSWLTVVLTATVEQRDSVTHVYTFFSVFFSTMVLAACSVFIM